MRSAISLLAIALWWLALSRVYGAEVILNEYNAVSAGSRLDDGLGIDSFFGTIYGNGGNWFELLVVGDHVDMRGWKMSWAEDEVVTGDVTSAGTITLADATIWSDLRSGSLITFIETADAGAEDIDTSTDLSYAPESGDWWINVATKQELTKDNGAVVSSVTNDGHPGDFSVGNRDWTLTIYDASDTVVFGPVGEGAIWADGVNGSEAGSLEGPQGADGRLATLEMWQNIAPDSSLYDDTSSSSFGAPNVDYDEVNMRFIPLQDLSPLRSQVVFPFDDGDFDQDGVLTIADLENLMQVLRSDPANRQYDVNRDGLVTDVDRTVWVELLKKTYFGDANLDGQFNSADLVFVLGAGQYEDEVTGNSTWSTGDWNGDGEFTTSDFVLALQAGGYEAGVRAAVPEPTSGTLFAVGLTTLLCLARFSRQATASHLAEQRLSSRWSIHRVPCTRALRRTAAGPRVGRSARPCRYVRSCQRLR